MTGNRNHKPNCSCPWCKRGKGEDIESFAKNIRKLSKGDLDEKLGTVKHQILKIVRAMTDQYKLMMSWQEKKEVIEDRLKELGFKP